MKLVGRKDMARHIGISINNFNRLVGEGKIILPAPEFKRGKEFIYDQSKIIVNHIPQRMRRHNSAIVNDRIKFMAGAFDCDDKKMEYTRLKEQAKINQNTRIVVHISGDLG